MYYMFVSVIKLIRRTVKEKKMEIWLNESIGPKPRNNH